jgi:Beta-lactamase
VTRRTFLTGTAVTAGALATGFASPSRALAEDASGVPVSAAGGADAALDQALSRLVQHPDGPPGIAALVRRGDRAVLHRAGTADLADGAPIQAFDSMRLASVSKAFSGAVALSLAADGTLTLDDTVGEWLPGLPRAWSEVTLRELLNHTSGIPDFSQTQAFGSALMKSPLAAPPPRVLLSYAGRRLNFPPGSRPPPGNPTKTNWPNECSSRWVLRLRAFRAARACQFRSCTATTWRRPRPRRMSLTCSPPGGEVHRAAAGLHPCRRRGTGPVLASLGSVAEEWANT